jgi:hypothetical protein
VGRAFSGNWIADRLQDSTKKFLKFADEVIFVEWMGRVDTRGSWVILAVTHYYFT